MRALSQGNRQQKQTARQRKHTFPMVSSLTTTNFATMVSFVTLKNYNLKKTPIKFFFNSLKMDSNVESPSCDSEQVNKRSRLNAGKDEQSRIEMFKLNDDIVSIGVMETIFNRKNGTPRQSGIVPESRGIIRLHPKMFNNAYHAFEGIEQFEFVWILYHFHENKSRRRLITKVHPPRLNGASCGVFASRAPHRPNPIGLTLAKIEAFKDGCLHVSGIDIIDNTPVIDIKPYIEKYDYPLKNDNFKDYEDSESSNVNIVEDANRTNNQQTNSNVPVGWVDGSVVSQIQVEFTARSLSQLSKFHSSSECKKQECHFCLRLFGTIEQTKNAIINLLKQDPRSVYRRNKCQDKLYFFTIDSVHLTAWFDEEEGLVEVVRIMPWTLRKSKT